MPNQLPYSMCPNMGFSLLHRKFLHPSTLEISHGFNPIILCFLVPLLALQVGNLSKLLLTPRHNRRRRRHQKDIEEALVDISSESQDSIKFDDTKRRKSMREHRKEHMRKSLRPKSHHMQVQIVNDSIHHHKKKKFKNGPIDDHIRVSRRTKFAQKGMFIKGSTRSRRRA
ncbi:hypothetical protein KY285_007401 [Solanum tuberosum]|nr:hypothetical protein KY285_007401 [Solanum tuberosum]